MHELPSIRVNRRELTRAAIVAAGLLTVLTLAVVVLAGLLGIRSKMDLLAYYAMVREHYHPLWKDLAWRRIRKGDSIESLLKRHVPSGREDYGPYTVLLYQNGRLVVRAKNGRLIGAEAWGVPDSKHIFFTTPSEERRWEEAYSAYMRQQNLEWTAFRIHRAVTGGQDVFLARLIERREVPYGHSEERMRELRKTYGQEYADSLMTGLTWPELTIEVIQVVHGDLQPGTTLTFPGDDCEHDLSEETEPVFLHLEDARLLYPRHQAQEIYLVVPRKALDWYQSLTPEQIKDLEVRCLAEWAKRGIDVRTKGTAGEEP